MPEFLQQIQNAVKKIHSQEPRTIDTAIILGSGLSDIAPELTNTNTLLYKDIINLPEPSVISHHGRLIIGEKHQQCVAICQGRHHLYEGYTAQQVSLMVYLLAQLGTKNIIITNAAGALNPNFVPGDIMLIEDHINFTGQNPIVGQNEDLGNRFVDLSQAYSYNLTNIAKQVCENHNIKHQTGVYAGVMGPSLETSAERRMLAKLGGDAVGMSTIIEVIAANHCNMQVLGLSAITNMALGDEHQQEDTIDEVLRYAAIAGKGMAEIINKVLGA